MFNNIDGFHNSNEYKIKQCTVCLEAWPVKSSPRSQKDSEYLCVRCSRDKTTPKKIFKTKLDCSFSRTFSTSRTHPNRRDAHCTRTSHNASLHKTRWTERLFRSLHKFALACTGIGNWLPLCQDIQRN